ncbi:FHA domain-containing protein [Cumulibacter manganitolerans]|uniref:FHA domain-containing protein n=1 Tax=Cumulibacter manganitolerans TaxID=1884992 RepID=UPI00129811F0|nr:FHA domain-containing protein [Cumulibacter manganitolerans]
MSLRYEVVPGSGMVARSGESILWVGTPVDQEAWEALGALLEIEPGSDPAGADTATALEPLQEVLDAHPRTTFAALVVSGERAQGVLRGPVTVCNSSEVAPATGHGQFGVTVPFSMTQAVFAGFHQPVANPLQLAELLDLDAGVVPGGGAWVHPVSGGRRHVADADTGVTAVHETEEPEAAPAGPPTGSHQAQPQSLPPVASTGAWASPATGEAGAASVPDGGAPASDAAGVFTPAADHERIDLRDVPVTGAPEPLPLIGTPAQPAPPAGSSGGAIVFDDGSTFALDRDYVIGRRPQKDPRVQSGEAEALTVVDPDSVLSSAHALISRREGQILLRDLGSLNGTHVAPPGATDWTRLEQHQEVPIVPGTRLLFGWTIATLTGPDER